MQLTPHELNETLQARLRQGGSVILDVKVIPRASNSEFCGVLADGSLKIKIAAVPDKGKANQELCRFLSELLALPQNRIEIVSGTTSQRKRIRLSSL